MKDLLADLQVGDEDFSLEHLERELAQLDDEPEPQARTQAGSLPMNAASLVVSHAQEQQSAAMAFGAPPSFAPAPADQGMDAWSLSLQNFTSLSLQEE